VTFFLRKGEKEVEEGRRKKRGMDKNKRGKQEVRWPIGINSKGSSVQYMHSM
jgi:hypothetical protein